MNYDSTLWCFVETVCIKTSFTNSPMKAHETLKREQSSENVIQFGLGFIIERLHNN